MSVEVRLHNPSELSKEQWRDIQTMQRDAYSSGTLRRRPQEEIDYIVQYDDFDRFYASHLDPNTEVGNRFNPNQSYTHPKVAVATEGDRYVGFAYSAHNVSGRSKAVRLVKQLSIVKDYLWIREIAISPEMQNKRSGIAQRLGSVLLANAFERQPVSAYIWPSEIPFLPVNLEELGFEKTGERQIDLYGTGELITQVRMEAPSVRKVRANLGR